MATNFGDCRKLICTWNLRLCQENSVDLVREPLENSCYSFLIKLLATAIQDVAITCLKSIWQTRLGWDQLGPVARSKTNRPAGYCLFSFRCDWRYH